MPEIGGWDGKTEQNHLKVPILPPLFQKTSVLIEKRKVLIDFLLEKISVPANFMSLQLIVPSECVSK